MSDEPTHTEDSLNGMLDIVQHDRIAGWAHDPAGPDRVIALLVSVNGRLAGRVQADAYREDLQQAGFGDGRKSFDLPLSPPLSALTPQLIEVRRETDGAHIPGSPQTLPAEIVETTPLEVIEPVAEEAETPEPDIPETPEAAEAPEVLKGYLDLVRRDLISGWAHDPSSADAPVSLLITVNEKLLARVMANRYREDLEQAGFGDGRRSFELVPTPTLLSMQRQIIAVRSEHDGAHLPGSPVVLEPEAAFDASTQLWMARVLADARDGDALDQRLGFLSAQLDSLLQRRADLRSHRFERQRRTPSETRESLKPRALFIGERAPAGSDDAGSDPVLSQLRSLQRLGFELSFAAADTAQDYAGLQALGIAGCGTPWYATVEEVLQREAHTFDLVVLHGLSIGDRYIALVRIHQPKARVVYSLQELQYLRIERQAKVEQRPELVTVARRAQVAELLTASRMDQVIIASAHEAELLRRQASSIKLQVVPRVLAACPVLQSFEQRRGILFAGSQASGPDNDAARWLVEEILPVLRRDDPSLPCLIAGVSIPASLRAADDGIEIVEPGYRLAELLERVRLCVAPLAYGAGVNGLVLDSLAAGLPCVCTPIAAEGLELPAALKALVADGAAAIAATIQRLHDDAAQNLQISQAGLDYVRERMSEWRIDGLMRAACLPSAPR